MSIYGELAEKGAKSVMGTIAGLVIAVVVLGCALVGALVYIAVKLL